MHIPQHRAIHPRSTGRVLKAAVWQSLQHFLLPSLIGGRPISTTQIATMKAAAHRPASLSLPRAPCCCGLAGQRPARQAHCTPLGHRSGSARHWLSPTATPAQICAAALSSSSDRPAQQQASLLSQGGGHGQLDFSSPEAPAPPAPGLAMPQATATLAAGISRRTLVGSGVCLAAAAGLTAPAHAAKMMVGEQGPCRPSRRA